MGTKIIKITLAAVCSCGVAAVAFPQDIPLDVPRRGGDPINALIEGRILLPSGQSANFNVKVTLSELNRPLATLYTNKHAEFRYAEEARLLLKKLGK